MSNTFFQGEKIFLGGIRPTGAPLVTDLVRVTSLSSPWRVRVI